MFSRLRRGQSGASGGERGGEGSSGARSNGVSDSVSSSPGNNSVKSSGAVSGGSGRASLALQTMLRRVQEEMDELRRAAINDGGGDDVHPVVFARVNKLKRNVTGMRRAVSELAATGDERAAWEAQLADLDEEIDDVVSSVLPSQQQKQSQLQSRAGQHQTRGGDGSTTEASPRDAASVDTRSNGGGGLFAGMATAEGTGGMSLFEGLQLNSPTTGTTGPAPGGGAGGSDTDTGVSGLSLASDGANGPDRGAGGAGGESLVTNSASGTPEEEGAPTDGGSRDVVDAMPTQDAVSAAADPLPASAGMLDENLFSEPAPSTTDADDDADDTMREERTETTAVGTDAAQPTPSLDTTSNDIPAPSAVATDVAPVSLTPVRSTSSGPTPPPRRKKKKTMRVGYERAEEAAPRGSAAPAEPARASTDTTSSVSTAKVNPLLVEEGETSAVAAQTSASRPAEPLDLMALMSSDPGAPATARATLANDTAAQGVDGLTSTSPDTTEQKTTAAEETCATSDALPAVSVSSEPTPPSVAVATTEPTENPIYERPMPPSGELPSVSDASAVLSGGSSDNGNVRSTPTVYEDIPSLALDVRIEMCLHSSDAGLGRLKADMRQQRHELARWTLRRRAAFAANAAKVAEKEKLEEEQMVAAEAEDYALADEIGNRLDTLTHEIESNDALIRNADKERLGVGIAKVHTGRSMAELRRETVGRLSALSARIGDEAGAKEAEVSRRREETAASAEIETEAHDASLEKVTAMLKVVEQQELEVEEKVSERTKPEEEKKASIEAELSGLREEERAILDELERKRAEIRSTEEALASVTNSIAELASKYDKRRERLAEDRSSAEAELAQIESEKRVLDERLQSEKDACGAIDEEALHMRGAADSCATEAARIEEDVRVSQENAVKEERTLKELETLVGRCDEMQAAVLRLDETLSSARNASREAELTTERLQKELATLASTITSGSSRIPQLEEEKRRAAAAKNFKKAGTLSVEVKKLTAEHEEALATQKTKQEELDASTATYAESESSAMAAEDELQTVTEEYDKCRYETCAVTRRMLRLLLESATGLDDDDGTDDDDGDDGSAAALRQEIEENDALLAELDAAYPHFASTVVESDAPSPSPPPASLEDVVAADEAQEAEEEESADNVEQAESEEEGESSEHPDDSDGSEMADNEDEDEDEDEDA